MKNQQHWEDLSAYFDGELKNPAKIEDLLREDAGAKKGLEEIQNLSMKIQSLPEPELHYSMASRVIARLKDARNSTPSWWFRIGTPLAEAAALAVIVSVTAQSMLQSPGFSTTPPADTTIVAEKTLVDGDIDTLYVTATDTSWIFSDQFRSTAPLEPDLRETMYLNFASIDWFDVKPYIGAEGYSDVRSTLNAMTEQEKNMMLLLLTDYAREGSTL